MVEALQLMLEHPVATCFIIIALGWAISAGIHGDKA